MPICSPNGENYLMLLRNYAGLLAAPLSIRSLYTNGIREIASLITWFSPVIFFLIILLPCAESGLTKFNYILLLFKPRL